MSPWTSALATCVLSLAACDEPCDPACDARPASCVGDSLRTYSAGACESGECVYSHTDSPCPGGCADATCLEPCEPIEWTTSRIGEGYDPFLALDREGGVHVSYRDPSHALTYARPSGDSWHREPVGSSTNFRHIVTASAPNDVHILFVHHQLLHATRSRGRWTFDPLAGDPHDIVSGLFVRDAHMDAAGTLHLLYGAGLTATYKRRAPDGTWQSSELVTTATGRAALAVDTSGIPHVVSSPGGAVHYATPRDGQWHTEVAPEPRRPCQDIAVGTHAGRMHVACATMLGRGLWYMLREPNGRWTTEAIENDGRRLSAPSIEVSHRGEPHVAYYDFSNGALRYASRSQSAWIVHEVDDTDDGGQNPSLALDATGTAHIAYRIDDLERQSVIHYARGRVCPRVSSLTTGD